ncbi:MAG: GNAT family N-acetyltransferase [Geminicoccaceae bacterium]
MSDLSEAEHDSGPTLRDLGTADLDWLLPLNNAAVPHVNHLDQDSLGRILLLSTYKRCVIQDGRPAGALIAFWSGADYASSNYQWFNEHKTDFLYIDRIIVNPEIHRSGCGRLLYGDIERFARRSAAKHLACEVNSQPPNPVSLGFHEKLGFRSVGELANQDRSKCVVLMMKPIAPEAAADQT